MPAENDLLEPLHAGRAAEQGERTERVEAGLNQRLLRAEGAAMHLLQRLQHQLQHPFFAGQGSRCRRRRIC